MTTVCMAVYMCVLIWEGGRRILLDDEEFLCCADSFINEEFDASDNTSVVIFTDWVLTLAQGL